MTVPVSKTQLEGIVLIMTELLNMNKPHLRDIERMFVYEIVEKVFNKIRVKSESSSYIGKKGLSITLTDHEARALHIFFKSIYIPVERYKYEAIALQMVSDDINHIYG